MQPSTPSVRTVAILALLVVGVVCSFAFHAAVTDTEITYAATAIEPGERPSRVAEASPDVADLDDRLNGESADVRRPIERAATRGSFSGNVTPELHIVLDDLRPRYAVYGGDYYRFNATGSEETTFVRIRMSPVAAGSVLANVSSPYGTAPPEIRAAIDSGTTSGWTVERGVYRHEGTYYAVSPERDAAVAGMILGGFAGYVLTPVGRGYAAVALGLLAYRYREPHRARLLTLRRASAMAALALPVALLGTLLFESGSASRFVTGPASALVVASGVVAGVLVRQRRWAALLGFTGVVVALPLVAGALALGFVGAVLGAFGLFVGLVTGVVPLLYGVAFGRRESGTADAVGERGDDAHEESST